MSAPRTASGKRLMAVMSTVPPQGRLGLESFVLSIEAEAGRIDVARLARALHREECPPDTPGQDPWCPGVHYDMARAMAIASAYEEEGA